MEERVGAAEKVALVPEDVVKLRVVIVARVAKRSVVVPAVTSSLPMVDDAEFKFWMVEEESAMSELGMVTRPFASTRNSDVVAEPMEFVDEAISKRGTTEPKVPWRASLAHGVEVPMVS